MTDAKEVWVPDAQDVFTKAVILREDGQMASVRVAKTGETRDVPANQLEKVNPPQFEQAGDMAELTYLNEPSVVHNLSTRWLAERMYTYSGLFLVAVNPYRALPIYDAAALVRYRGAKKEDVDPHIYAVAETAYRSMRDTSRDQSILITGESGAGKTENTKKAIQYLSATTGASSLPGETGVDERILQTNPILEAFGNAQTVRNANSSRFGKFIKISFAPQAGPRPSATIAGASIEWYLLEKSRVVTQHASERSYHVFYQLLAGAPPDLRTKLGLPSTDPADFAFLKGGAATIPGIDDAALYSKLVEALAIMGFAESQVEQIWVVVASILLLGEIAFKATSADQGDVVSMAPVERVCALLGVAPEAFVQAVLQPRMRIGRETSAQSRTAAQAQHTVAAVAKALYERLFGHIVSQLNARLGGRTGGPCIGVLDIAGFEIFEKNSFEQLCINYTNEKLQQFFNHHMFVLEQEEYVKEEVDWQYVDYGSDLQPTIDLIEKGSAPMGVFSCLNEESMLPSGSETSFNEKLAKQWGSSNPKFAPSRLGHGFTIAHYAQAVDYTTDGWLEKNKDPLSDAVEGVLACASQPLIAELFMPKDNTPPTPGSTAGSTGKSKALSRTVAQRHKEQLGDLMAHLAATQPHFVRCILPNTQRSPSHFDNRLVLDQLRYNGVLEGIRIARSGFPNRLEFREFFARYAPLASGRLPAAHTQQTCAGVLAKIGLDPSQYKVGLSKVFFRNGVLADLEGRLERLVAQQTLTVQAHARGALVRSAVRTALHRRQAAQLLARCFKISARNAGDPWWQLTTGFKPLLLSKESVDSSKRDLRMQRLETALHRLKEEQLELLASRNELRGELIAALKDKEELSKAAGERKELEEAHALAISSAAARDEASKAALAEIGKRLNAVQDELEAKKAELEEAKAEATKAKDAENVLKEQLSAGEEAKKETEAAKDEAKKLAEELAEAKSAIEAAKSSAKTELDAAKADAEGKAASVASLQKEVDAAKNSAVEADAAKKEAAKAQSDLTKSQTKLGKAEKFLLQAKSELEAAAVARAEAVELKKQLAEAAKQDEKHARLQDEHSELQTKHTALQTKHKSLQTEHNSQQTEHKSAQTELEALQAELASAVKEASTAKKEATTAKAGLDTANKELTTVKAELTSAKTELTTAKKDLTSTKSNFDATKKELATSQSSLKALQAEHATLQKEHTTLQKEHTAQGGAALDAALADAAKLRADLDVATENMLKLDEELGAAKTAATAAARRADDQRAQQTKLEQALATLRSEKQSVDNAHTKLASERRELAETNVKLAAQAKLADPAELRALRASTTQLRADAAASAAEKARLEEANAALASDKKSLGSERLALLSDKEKLVSEKLGLNAANEQLTAEVARLRKEVAKAQEMKQAHDQAHDQEAGNGRPRSVSAEDVAAQFEASRQLSAVRRELAEAKRALLRSQAPNASTAPFTKRFGQPDAEQALAETQHDLAAAEARISELEAEMGAARRSNAQLLVLRQKYEKLQRDKAALAQERSHRLLGVSPTNNGSKEAELAKAQAGDVKRLQSELNVLRLRLVRSERELGEQGAKLAEAEARASDAVASHELKHQLRLAELAKLQLAKTVHELTTGSKATSNSAKSINHAGDLTHSGEPLDPNDAPLVVRKREVPQALRNISNDRRVSEQLPGEKLAADREVADVYRSRAAQFQAKLEKAEMVVQAALRGEASAKDEAARLQARLGRIDDDHNAEASALRARFVAAQQQLTEREATIDALRAQAAAAGPGSAAAGQLRSVNGAMRDIAAERDRLVRDKARLETRYAELLQSMEDKPRRLQEKLQAMKQHEQQMMLEQSELRWRLERKDRFVDTLRRNLEDADTRYDQQRQEVERLQATESSREVHLRRVSREATDARERYLLAERELSQYRQQSSPKKKSSPVFI